MAESYYDILKIQAGASKKDIRRAYRNLVLKLHSDKGGDDEQFKKIKRAYEDLQLGKTYPDTADERKEKAKFYSGDSSACLLYTSPSPRDATLSRMPSSA